MNKKEYLFISGGAAGGGYSQVIPMEEVSTMSPLRSLWVIISTLAQMMMLCFTTLYLKYTSA